MTSADDVSVIICAYSEDRWDELIAAVRSVQRQTLVPKEIIIVIDHNACLRERVEEEIAGVIVVENDQERGLSGARNSGIAVARGKVIAFLDDDAIAMPGWLESLRGSFNGAEVLGCGGPVIPLWLEDAPGWLPEEFYWVVGCTYRGMVQTVGRMRNPIGANMCFRREVFDRVGGFRSGIGRIGRRPLGCEETELCLRIRRSWTGGVLLYQPDAKVLHHVAKERSGWGYFCARCYSEGLSKAMVTRCAGMKGSLATEWRYSVQTLPRGVMRGLVDGFVRLDVGGLLRVGAMMVGLLLTIGGYVVGSIGQLVQSAKGRQEVMKSSRGEDSIESRLEVSPRAPLRSAEVASSAAQALFHHVRTNSVLLSNAGSLIGTTGVTSLLGFVYWWLAARQFSAQAVGLAAASISAMMLLGTLASLGLNTLLIGELPRLGGKEGELISTALVVVGGVGGCLGMAYGMAIPSFSSELQGLGTGIEAGALFAIGVSLAAMTFVLDQALIGLLRGELQLWRNTLFAGAKLGALFVAGMWLSQRTGLAIYLTWMIGTLVSLGALGGMVIVRRRWAGPTSLRGWATSISLPQWGLLRKLGLAALMHHALNVTLQAPALLLPVLVTVVLSARVDGWFYACWNLASVANTISVALATTLYAVSSPWMERDSLLEGQGILSEGQGISPPDRVSAGALAQRMRLTLSLAFLACVLANCVLLLATRQVLGLFGHSYAEQGVWSLRILSLESFPFIIKNHYITLARIRGQIVRTILLLMATGLLELGASSVGARLGGLDGLSLGWFAAMCVEAMCMSRTVYTAMRTKSEGGLAGSKCSGRCTPCFFGRQHLPPPWKCNLATIATHRRKGGD